MNHHIVISISTIFAKKIQLFYSNGGTFMSKFKKFKEADEMLMKTKRNICLKALLF